MDVWCPQNYYRRLLFASKMYYALKVLEKNKIGEGQNERLCAHLHDVGFPLPISIDIQI